MEYLVTKTQQIAVTADDPDAAIRDAMDGKGKVGQSSYSATARQQGAQSRPTVLSAPPPIARPVPGASASTSGSGVSNQ